MPVDEHQVRDGERTLTFNGDLLAESTSHRRGQARWIEFKLYRTRAGSYVLSRVGNSLVFHQASCALVPQYRLKSGEYTSGAVPCDLCNPLAAGADVYPERARYWAQVMERPQAVLEALYQYDDSGTKYMTLVAQRLMHEAAQTDEQLAFAYRVEHVA